MLQTRRYYVDMVRCKRWWELHAVLNLPTMTKSSQKNDYFHYLAQVRNKNIHIGIERSMLFLETYTTNRRERRKT